MRSKLLKCERNSPLDEKQSSESEERTSAQADSPNEPRRDQTHRTLKGRHIQLISIGGTIGTVLFVQIGSALPIGGPGSLLVAILLWSTVVLAINNCLAEMVTWIPISSPYVRFADRFVDEAMGVCSGINLFFGIGLGIPYELTAFNLMLNFWTDKIPVVSVNFFMIVAYAAINLFAVRFYGETEFYLAIGKVILIVGLTIFTFVVMVGGNPEHDAFGFRNWKVPGAPFVAYVYEGPRGQFLGFLGCLVQAAFTVGGPEYTAITAGEAAHPRHTLPRSFRTITTRLLVFFGLGALSVGILVPYTDPNLLATAAVRPGAGTSPYVIAMERLRLGGLAHAVNALVMLSIFSAGNNYVYTASRTLFGLALEGRVPRVLAKCNSRGVPVYSICVTMILSLLAFLQLSHTSAVVLLWCIVLPSFVLWWNLKPCIRITRLVTVSAMANYAIIALTYLRFHAALKAQGISRESLPHRSAWQPFCAYYAFTASFAMCFIAGYAVFLPGHWNAITFVFSYALFVILPVIFFAWKFLRGTRRRILSEVDFFTAERAEVDAYECGLETDSSKA